MLKKLQDIQAHQAPQAPQFGAPPPQFAAPPPQFNAPPAQFNAPPAQFNAPPAQFAAPPAQFAAPPQFNAQPQFPGQAQANPQSGSEVDKYKEMLQILAMYNILVVLDDSGSMELSGINNNVSRWSEALEAIDLVLKYATQYDKDGVDVFFLNAPCQFNIQQNDKILDKIRENKIFPRGGTPLGAKLQSIFNDFKDLYSHNKKRDTLSTLKPINVIVITDGEPSDKDALLNSIVNICQFFEDERRNVTEYVGVQFFQVGNDKSATEYLRMLDDDIKDKCRLRSGRPVPDIVDSTCFNPVDPLPLKFIITKVLLGGINASLDNDRSHETRARAQGSSWGSFIGTVGSYLF